MSDDDLNWRDSLPDDLKGNETLAKYGSVEDAAKALVEVTSMVGNSIRLPGEDASDEQKNSVYNKILERSPGLMRRPNFENDDERNDFYKSLGRPDEAGDYASKDGFDSLLQETLRSAAHSAGLSSSQYESLLNDVIEHDKGSKTAFEGKRMEQLRELKGEWGLKFDDNKAIAEKVRDTFLDFIPSEQMDARTIKALHTIGTQLVDAGAGVGDHRHEGDPSVMTPADARAAISEIMNNPDHAYWNPHDPGNAAALEHMVELQGMANPQASRELQRAGFGS